MSGIMRVSTLSWENLDQLAVITPNDILEITAMVGKEVEELAGPDPKFLTPILYN